MKLINLIPRGTQERLARRRRLRLWMLGLGTYAACLALAGAAIRIGLRSGASDVSRYIEAEVVKVRSFEGEQLKGKTVMASLRKQIDAANATGRHPNWGILLDAVSQALNAQTVLDNVELVKTKVEPVKDAKPKVDDTKARKGASSPRTEFSILLRGRSQSVEAMGQMLVGLEKFKVFRQVKLGDNRRVEVGVDSIIEFQVSCFMDSSDPLPVSGGSK